MKDLIQFLKELLEHLGFGSVDKIPVVDYSEMCTKYGVTEIEPEQEAFIQRDFGAAVLLINFKNSSNPFWNMARDLEKDIAFKIDVILCGQETIGSAERSCDPTVMRHVFKTQSGRSYSRTLYRLFGKDRVDKELSEFLSFKFFPRIGGGIGLDRLIRAMFLAGLLKNTEGITWAKPVV